MKKINILKNNRDFDRIISNKNSYKYRDYIIYLEPTNEVYKFGISVSKKLGNAVNRNKIKRQIKTIIDKYDYQKNFNCIIIVLRSVLTKSYATMNTDLEEALKKLNLIK